MKSSNLLVDDRSEGQDVISQSSSPEICVGSQARISNKPDHCQCLEVYRSSLLRNRKQSCRSRLTLPPDVASGVLVHFPCSRQAPENGGIYRAAQMHRQHKAIKLPCFPRLCGCWKALRISSRKKKWGNNTKLNC